MWIIDGAGKMRKCTKLVKEEVAKVWQDIYLHLLVFFFSLCVRGRGSIVLHFSIFIEKYLGEAGIE